MKRLAIALSALVACGGGAALVRSPPTESKRAPEVPSGASSANPSVASLAASASPNASAPTNPTPLDAVPMLGPFKNLAEACKAIALGGGKAKAFDCVPGAGLASPPKDAPIDRATLLVLSDKAHPDASVTHLTLHVGASWFVHPNGPESSTDAAMMKRYRTDIIPDSGPVFFPAGAIPGTTYGLRYDFAELTFVVSTDPGTAKKSSPQFHGVRDAMVVCAMGASGRPSCIDPVRSALQLGKNGVPPPEVEKVSFSFYAGVWNVDATKHVTMLRAAGHLDAHAEVPLAGPYVLRFP